MPGKLFTVYLMATALSVLVQDLMRVISRFYFLLTSQQTSRVLSLAEEKRLAWKVKKSSSRKTSHVIAALFNLNGRCRRKARFNSITALILR